MTLTEFLLARIAEDEVSADIAAIDAQTDAVWPWSPRRVQAECMAKRAVVRSYVGVLEQQPISNAEGLTLNGATEALALAVKILALPYSAHRDYHGEWRV